MQKQGIRYQPRYSAKLKEENGGHVLVNAALTRKAKYADILFSELTPEEEYRIHLAPIFYWALCWISIILYVHDFISKGTLNFVVFFACLNHVGSAHDSGHMLKTTMPWYLRILSGVVPFCAGFMPVVSTYSDTACEHNKTHHQTKGVLDIVPTDRDSWYSQIPVWHMMLSLFFNPCHTAPWDIIMYQWGRHRPEMWFERIALNMVHWLQLAMLFNLGGPNTFWNVLGVGHLAMFVTWGVLHGVLHRSAWYKFITTVDPSGARNLHPWIEIVGRTTLPAVWLGVKWHDVHHAFTFGMPSLNAPMIRGYSYDEINEKLADLFDEGLFVDVGGKPVSHLAEIGHELGSRKRHLMEMRKCI